MSLFTDQEEKELKLICGNLISGRILLLAIRDDGPSLLPICKKLVDYGYKKDNIVSRWNLLEKNRVFHNGKIYLDFDPETDDEEVFTIAFCLAACAGEGMIIYRPGPREIVVKGHYRTYKSGKKIWIPERRQMANYG